MPHPRHHLVTGGFGAYEDSALALARDANGGFFHTAKAYAGQETPAWMHEDWNAPHRREKRGFGYWFYKIMIVERALKEAAEGDTVWWVDAGCTIDPTHPRWYEWERSFVDFFQVRVPGCQERVWSKGDAFKHFNVGYEDPIATSEQLAGGFFAVRKTPVLLEHLQTLKKHMGNWSIVKDEDSVAPNWTGFRENRHDQTVMSLANKVASRDGRISLFIEEDHEALEPSSQVPGKSYPIMATRRTQKSAAREEGGDVESGSSTWPHTLTVVILLVFVMVFAFLYVFMTSRPKVPSTSKAAVWSTKISSMSE